MTAITTQRSRSRANCDCGEACFYCGRQLSAHRHEHDHFPIPWRHGGDQTVATCIECHTLKDRAWPIGMRRDMTVDAPVFAAISKGLESLPAIGEIPMFAFALSITWAVLGDEGADPWDIAWEVDGLAAMLVDAVPQCSTPEARIWLAQSFLVCLDRLERRLQRSRTVAHAQPAGRGA